MKKCGVLVLMIVQCIWDRFKYIKKREKKYLTFISYKIICCFEKKGQPGRNLLINWQSIAILMARSHRSAVTILYAHLAFWVYGLEIDTVRYITVVKGVERCRTVREIGHDIHDVSNVIKQIKSPHFFAHRQNCRDIFKSMPTAVRCERAISIWNRAFL